jgi:hypothetical protein
MKPLTLEQYANKLKGKPEAPKYAGKYYNKAGLVDNHENVKAAKIEQARRASPDLSKLTLVEVGPRTWIAIEPTRCAAKAANKFIENSNINQSKSLKACI